MLGIICRDGIEFNRVSDCISDYCCDFAGIADSIDDIKIVDCDDCCVCSLTSEESLDIAGDSERGEYNLPLLYFDFKSGEKDGFIDSRCPLPEAEAVAEEEFCLNSNGKMSSDSC